MEEKEFKYRSEFSIGMYLGPYMFLQETELESFAAEQKVFTKSSPCNIYSILKRSRLSLDPEYLEIKEDYIELRYFIHVEDEKLERFVKMSPPPGLKEIFLKSTYPYNALTLYDNEGKSYYIKLSVIIDETQKLYPAIEPELDYEVLYIGQAFGKDGKRTAIDRLSSHSTLQKIYSEAMQRNPDSEIWIMLAHFQEQTFGVMNGRIKVSNENDQKEGERFMNFMNPISRFTDKQRINFTEAALIQSFLPKYNKEYKGTFPNPAHTSYKECYDLDVNGIVVETDTSMSKRWLFSEEKPRHRDGIPFWQHGKFHFVSDNDRYKMFNNEFL